jgi:transcription-repair coupling factor (superfamily II helicase)
MKQNQENFSAEFLAQELSNNASGVNCSGLAGSERACFVYRLYKAFGQPFVVVAATPKEALTFIEDLHFFAGTEELPVLYFPTYNIQPFKTLAYHSETTARRVQTLHTLLDYKAPPLLVTTVGALMQKVVPKSEMSRYADLILEGEEIDREKLIQKLVNGGYVRTAVTEEPGDFSVRGGILDIFSPLYADPLRVELFGDLVDSIRSFSAETQRTQKRVEEAVILPAREAILDDDTIDQVVSNIRARASIQGIPVTKVREFVSKVKRERMFPGFESLLPLMYPKLDTLFDYIPDDAVFIQLNSNGLHHAALKLEEQAEKNYKEACNTGRLCVETATMYMTWPETALAMGQKKTVRLSAFAEISGGQTDADGSYALGFSVTDNTEIRMALKRLPDKDNLLQPLADWITEKVTAGHLTLLTCNTATQAKRLQSLLTPYGIQTGVVHGFPDGEAIASGKPGAAFICLGRISSGFVWPGEMLSIVTEGEIFGAKHHKPIRRRTGSGERITAFEDLKQGHFVVHDDHGIGRYEGLVKLKLNGSTNDFILIVYQDEDKLYLPVDRMEMIHKYMGVEGITPVPDKLGGKTWARMKSKVKRSAEKMAGELLDIYAARKIMKGFGFSEVDGLFKDFEAGFSFEETEDQSKAIEDVIRDMQEKRPMDRLICGDVGYGKTEVALRASFLCINNDKQIGVLVPTTVLAEQHYATFSSRFKRYPINVACLSRFRSPKEQRAILADLKAGKIDIIIGTHRLLQKDIAFKDLGLLIIDEEQRFGVKHKEKLKKIRSTVDVLALTATPIPRTLYLSLMGIRDISVISTPPEYRKAIITYISGFDDAVVSSGIRTELSRGGQIFFVHNNIQSIERMAARLKKLVPEVRLAIAHGQLDENELERVMFLFVNKEIDMLVCTTIIESGLDIPSANTILVNRADMFGLAQIYQLRGRVGRSEEQAYAYLFIPDESMLGKNAQKRLKVLMEYSDLGSGFQIAMSDLRIRGGGTILGASQSGHIAAVGYDLFLRLMETAVSELKGEPVIESLDPEVNLPISAYIPESYIPEIDQRLSSYRRLSKMTDTKEISQYKTELIDRFGQLPEEAMNLLYKILIKTLCRKAGIKRYDLIGGQLKIFFSQTHMKNPHGVVTMINLDPDRYNLSNKHVLKIKLFSRNINGLLGECKNILKEVVYHVNSEKF